jgi:hypothetical protein
MIRIGDDEAILAQALQHTVGTFSPSQITDEANVISCCVGSSHLSLPCVCQERTNIWKLLLVSEQAIFEDSRRSGPPGVSKLISWFSSISSLGAKCRIRCDLR